MTKLGERLIKSARQARVIARGEAPAVRVFTPPDVDVAAVRKKTRLLKSGSPGVTDFPAQRCAIGSSTAEPRTRPPECCSALSRKSPKR
jgi:hypothetical protein